MPVKQPRLIKFLLKLITVLIAPVLALVLSSQMGYAYDPLYKVIHGYVLPSRLMDFEVDERLRKFGGRLFDETSEFPPLWSTHPSDHLTVDLKISSFEDGACEEKVKTNSQIWVVEHTGADDLPYENLRVSGRGGEVVAVIPNGSLVYLEDPFDEQAEKWKFVRVLSIAPHIRDELQSSKGESSEEPLATIDGQPLVEFYQEAFIWHESLKPVSNYALDLGASNVYLEHAQENGYDFSNHAFVAQVDRDGFESSLTCKTDYRGSQREYKLFSLINRETRKIENEIAISLNDPYLLYSASAIEFAEGENLQDPLREKSEAREKLAESFRRGQSLHEHLDEEENSNETMEAEALRTKYDQALRGSIHPAIDVPGVRVYKRAVHFKVCTFQDDMLLRDENERPMEVKLPRGTRVRFLQSFEGEASYERPDAEKDQPPHLFYRIQALVDGKLINGYASRKLVLSNDECKEKHRKREEEIAKMRNPGPVTSLNSMNCCVYPVQYPPLEATHGLIGREHSTKRNAKGKYMWQTHYGAGREPGRDHGGVDLVRPYKEFILSVAPGTIMNYNERYAAPSAIPADCAFSVNHNDAFEAEYAELVCNLYNEAEPGGDIEDGQMFARVGINGRRPENMLHFELYTKVKMRRIPYMYDGSQLHGGGRFNRRGDNTDPTPYLIKWFNMRWPDRKAP